MLLFKNALILLISAWTFSVLPSFWSASFQILDAEARIHLHIPSDDITASIGGLKTQITFDPAHLDDFKMTAEVKVATLTTGNAIRDIRFTSRKLLSRKKYPIIHFKSEKIQPVVNGYLVTGLLKIKDTEKPMVLDLTYRNGVIEGVSSINLLDFGIPISEIRRENKLDVYLYLPVAN
ncbi:YceI family protein [Ascidiimonas aurantiaca]|uniref:YceI family protein n=1 Tax=Ascidiimonas aurantiaca TaxID=1685432 RepID=UPI0030EDBD12